MTGVGKCPGRGFYNALEYLADCTSKQDDIILRLLLGDGDAVGVVIEDGLGCGPVPKQLSQPVKSY